jgi:4'-phosphopantetheinyl transferase EntD
VSRRADVERFDTAHGVVAIVELADDARIAAALAALPAAEQAHARTLTEVRRRELIAGRTALHALLAEVAPEVAGAPILADDRGAPALPAGWAGSISHKGARAAALIAPAGAARVGVDLELAQPARTDIARRILTERERTVEIDGRGATLRFSIKEAIYKAVDPFVRRYVAFTEVELDVAEGHALVTTALPFAIEATWREHAGFWLTTARAVPRRDLPPFRG